MTTTQAPSKSRQRLLDALNHRQPDRIPVDFGASPVTGIHVSCIAELRDHFGLDKHPVKVTEPFQMLGEVEDDLRDALGSDVKGVPGRKVMFGFENKNWKPWRLNGLEVLVPGDFNVTVADNGDILMHPQGDVTAPPSARMPKGFHFFDAIIRQNHFDPEHLDPADNLEEFGPMSDSAIDDIAADVKAANDGEYALFGNFGGCALGDIALVPAVNLKDPRGIRDVAEWYVSTRSRRDYIHKIYERQVEFALGNLERIHARIGDSIDIIFLCGTDFGTQSSSFCSVATFNELWFPYYKQMCDWIHGHTSWKIFKHTCGSAARFFDSMVDAGIDIVNPVQCSAVGMEPEQLKAKYGDRLTFWGGGVDTQQVLPFGTPEQVREQVLRRCEIFAPGGGFVFNTIHNIQAETPVANILAMVNALRSLE